MYEVVDMIIDIDIKKLTQDQNFYQHWRYSGQFLIKKW